MNVLRSAFTDDETRARFALEHYAEWPPLIDPAQRLEPGDVVGLHGGAIQHTTARARTAPRSPSRWRRAEVARRDATLEALPERVQALERE